MQNNYEIARGRGKIVLHINPSIYSLDSIMMTANDFLEQAYVIVDGDVEEDILVTVILKNPPEKVSGLKEAALSFNNELIRNSFYIQQSIRTAELRKTMLEASLFTTFSAARKGNIGKNPAGKDDAEKCPCSSETSQTSRKKSSGDKRMYLNDSAGIRIVKKYEKA